MPRWLPEKKDDFGKRSTESVSRVGTGGGVGRTLEIYKYSD